MSSEPSSAASSSALPAWLPLATALLASLVLVWFVSKQPLLIAGGAGDNAAGAVGVGVVRPGDAFLSLGTSGVLFRVTERFAPAPSSAVHAFCAASDTIKRSLVGLPS